MRSTSLEGSFLQSLDSFYSFIKSQPQWSFLRNLHEAGAPPEHSHNALCNGDLAQARLFICVSIRASASGGHESVEPSVSRTEPVLVCAAPSSVSSVQGTVLGAPVGLCPHGVSSALPSFLKTKGDSHPLSYSSAPKYVHRCPGHRSQPCQFLVLQGNPPTKGTPTRNMPTSKNMVFTLLGLQIKNLKIRTPLKIIRKG